MQLSKQLFQLFEMPYSHITEHSSLSDIDEALYFHEHAGADNPDMVAEKERLTKLWLAKLPKSMPEITRKPNIIQRVFNLLKP